MSQKFYKSKTHILSAGNKDVLSTKENATSFIDISLYKNDKSFLCRYDTLSYPDMIQIESGDCSMIALTKQGHVYGRGRNLWGELALGDIKPKNNWAQIPIPFQVKQISCKSLHSLFLTENGQVYSCGHNAFGQLGISNYDSQSIAQCILTNKKAIKVVTGMGPFSFVICESTNVGSCENNDLYASKSKTMLFAFGWNEYGQLGINKQDSTIKTPIQVEFFAGKSAIQDVQTGIFHSIVLLVDGSMYAMGLKNCCGQASATNDFYSPVLVSVGNPIQSICCSRACSMIQTMNGKWYAFGNVKNQLSPAYGKEVSLTPERIDDVFPKGIQVKKLVATYCSFFLLTTGNDLYVVGKGGCGEMGMNHYKNIGQWTLCKKNIVDVQTGNWNSFIFIPNPFLICESQMEYTNIVICFQ